ncbi:FAD-dependent oxidoreductase [Arthrobacter sp. M4]|uniref:FAD-dependent oxidoreductase n=1 Tax=Arthrobacter sp. M4 TaxID=218160 RepID=UPI001CDC059A|nr:FAD-dependent oxidoreductase [Arthrobacter sp. M4]MCA4133627.1 FAD-dependent oxidoreductase [Arthrobacter sp. M4]
MSASAITARTRLVIAGAGPAALALVHHLHRHGYPGSITLLSNRDDCPTELLEAAALPQVSLRLGQPASYLDSDSRTVSTVDGMEFPYDQLVIATGSVPDKPAVTGSARCLSYSTVDDAGTIGQAVTDVTRVLGRRPLGILVGTGPSAGQAEAVLRARGVRPVRTSLRPASVMPTVAGSVLPATGIIFEDGSTMNADLVVLAEERTAQDQLAATAGIRTAPAGGIEVDRHYRASAPDVWAIGDAAALDGVRLGLMVSAETAARTCAAGLLAGVRGAFQAAAAAA